MYALGGELITDGAHWITQGTDAWEKIALVINFEQFALATANSIRITSESEEKVRRWIEDCRYIDEETKLINRIIVPRQRVDSYTFHNVQPNFEKIAEAIEHGEELFFNLVKFIEKRIYVNPLLDDSFN